MPRALAMRNLSPASTPQPRSCRAATVASSCATGIQTFRPELPCDSMPRCAKRLAERFAAAACTSLRPHASERFRPDRSTSRTTRRCRRCDTHPAASRRRPSTRATVVASPDRTASRRSGPSDFETERRCAQRARPGSQSEWQRRSVMSKAWSSSSTSTAGWRTSTSLSSRARSAVDCGAVGVLRAGGERARHSPAA